jgi:hypothetical protein
MKRATITFPDELEQKISRYLDSQMTPPTLSMLVQVALDDFLDRHAWSARQYCPATNKPDLPVSDAPVEADVSLEHDEYL